MDPFESLMLTNSSIRLAIRGDDAWIPDNILLLGRTVRETVALALEMVTGTVTLSTDDLDGYEHGQIGHLSMPLNLVGSGSSATVIESVLLLVRTDHDNDGTRDKITLTINTASGNVLTQPINHPATTQPDLEAGAFNWYGPYDVVPFTRSDLLADGAGITLSTDGEDAWRPRMVFVLGFNDNTGARPTEIVTLVSIPEWTSGYLSTDHTEGKPSVTLPVV